MRTRGRGKSRGVREKCRYGIEILECADRKKSLEARFHPFPFILTVCQKFHEDPWKKCKKNSWDVCVKIQRHGGRSV